MRAIAWVSRHPHPPSRSPSKRDIRVRPTRGAGGDASRRDSGSTRASGTRLTPLNARAPAAQVEVLSKLEELRSFKFFSLYNIDMLANCAYIGGAADECEFDACEVLPEEPAPLALMERDSSEREFELDSWARLDLPSEDYYDLEEYPEGYTAYDGSHVWEFIYDKLSFAGTENRTPSTRSSPWLRLASSTGFSPMPVWSIATRTTW